VPQFSKKLKWASAPEGTLLERYPSAASCSTLVLSAPALYIGSEEAIPKKHASHALQGFISAMKKIAIFATAFVFILLLTKIANQMPPEPPPGTAFSLKAQQVVECTPEEITLVDVHQTETHLEKDSSWPDCSTFHKDQVLDFYLSRGEKTKFLSEEQTTWWRKAM
jgi:hypothetical protein